MRQTTAVASLLLAPVSAASGWGLWNNKDNKYKCKGEKCMLPLVNSEGLQREVNLENVLLHASNLQAISESFGDGNRNTGTQSHNATVDYIYNTLAYCDNYWDVELQPFTADIQMSGSANLTVEGETAEVAVMTFSPSFSVKGVELFPVPNEGCVKEDYDASVLSGKIALISRGSCSFSDKSALSGAAGAVGAIVYNNVPGGFQGTLGGVENKLGPLVPTSSMAMELGLTLMERLAAGPVTVDYLVKTDIQTVFSHNVIATSKIGDPDNMLFLGAHSDSVAAGPGINDNGSGSSALLAIAVALSRFKVNQAVRMAWWTAEESGLLGSTHYVTTAPVEDLMKVRQYQNFDMIASPNFVLGVYDGSGEAFNITGPPGSSEIQKLFQEHFESVGRPFVPAAFNGRSDYGPFLSAGVPCGGLFTGAEQLKTDEEAVMFGGEAGVAFDVNYHAVGDTFENLNYDAFEVNTKAIAHSVATYATSFDGFPQRLPMDAPVKVKRTSSAHGHDHDHAPAKRDEHVRGIEQTCSGHDGDIM